MEEKLKKLPHRPGCYLMKNKNGLIIYVGKAKDLKKRVITYFNRQHTGKTAMLVKEIVDLDYIVTNTETESLVLELNLIKKHQPKYNILYRDDKTYPYIAITKQKVPRIKIYRSLYKEKENMDLFGPYPNVMAARNMVELLNRLYPLPKCRVFPKEKCLYYHLGQCLGYCTENIDQNKINQMVKEIKQFLVGDNKKVKQQLNKEIKQLNIDLKFEQSRELNKYLEAIQVFDSMQIVEIKQLINADIIGYYLEQDYLAINILFVRYGKVINSVNYIFPIINEVEEEIIKFIFNYYQKHQIKPNLVISAVNSSQLEDLINIKTKSPQKGDLLKLIKISDDNAHEYFKQNIDALKKQSEQKAIIWEELAKDLKINQLNRIELIDNAHLFGSYAVSGLVVYEDGIKQPAKYRKFKIKYSKTNDDYAMMYEAIYRRFQGLLVEGAELPDVLIVDGGMGQINKALEVMQGLGIKTKVYGLKKDDKHKTSALIDDVGQNISVSSSVKNLLTQMQDEVHRYTITYHDKYRTQGNMGSELDYVKGLGPQKRAKLYKEYSDINKMKLATFEELSKIVGVSVAKQMIDSWHQN